MLKLFTIAFLMLSVSAATPTFAAKSKNHRKMALTTITLGPCSEVPASCTDAIDTTETCKAVYGKENLEEGAYDSDNMRCVQMRLWKKVCAKGWASEKFKVTCR
jgi:hypothetical protein